MAALRATLEILDDDALRDPEVARHFVDNMRRSTEQLERTLHDLVTLARFETATLVADETAAMTAMVTRAVAQLAPLAEAKHVRVLTDIADAAAAARVKCDPSAIARALSNLLENAVHASPSSTIRIGISCPEKNVVAVEIANEPSSVPLGVRTRLFERAHAGTGRDRAGSGLRLAIVRAAVEAHGGSGRFVELGPPRVRGRLELPR